MTNIYKRGNQFRISGWCSYIVFKIFFGLKTEKPVHASLDHKALCLDRLKELESAETALRKIANDPSRYIIHRGCEYWIAYHDSENAKLLTAFKEVVESRDRAYKENRELKYKIEYEMKPIRKGGFWS